VTATSVADTSKSASATISVPAAPAITTAALATATVGATYAQPLTATGGIAPYAWTLVSGTLPSCLTITQSASGASLGGTLTAACAGTFNDLVFKVTDSGTPNALTATTAAIGLTINAAPVIVFSGVVPGTATAHVAYAGGSAAASGGVGTLTYSIFSGTLPNGLSLNAGTGAITGTPTTANTFNFVIKAADTFGDSNTQAYQIVVSAPTITFTGVVPATASAHVAYAGGSAAATGGVGTLTYSVFSGALPDGLSLNASTAAITGTPGTANTFNFVIKAADTYGDSNTQAYQIVVSAPPAITFSGVVPATASAHVAYAGGSAAATGGVGTLTYSVFSGALPDGLSLNSSTAAITGTPGTANTFNFVIKAVDAFGDSNTQAYQIVVSAPPAITFSGVVPATASAHVAYAGGSAAATGGVGTLTYSVFSGALPDGLSLNSSTAAITGTPGTANTFNFVIKAADAFGDSNTQAYQIVVSAPPAIVFSGVVPATATYNVAYPGGSASATGGAGTLTYTVFSGALPNGLGINATTGAITGTPTAGGTFNFVIKAADAFGDSNTQAYSIVVSYPTLTVTPASLPTGYVGSTYTQTSLSATGGTGVAGNYTFALANGSTLPAGLGLSPGGVITGQPSGSPGYTNFSITVTDTVASLTSAVQAFSITVDAGVSITTATTLPSAYGGSLYSQTLAATGGSGTGYSWTVTAGASGLSALGLSLSSTGVLSGTTPLAGGTANFTAKVTDSVSNTTSVPFTLTINAGLTITTTSPLPSGYGGSQYSQQLATSGGAGGPYIWTVTAGESDLTTLGLTLSAGGLLTSGGPNQGLASFTVQVTDSALATARAQFTVSILQALTINSATTFTGYAGVPFSQALTTAGGTGTGLVWSIWAGSAKLTAIGLSLGSDGTITGASPILGSATFEAKVVDTAGNQAYQYITITINAASQVSGNISLNNACGPIAPLPSYSVTITGGGYTHTAPTDTNGNYSFTGIPDGTYTITPTITGPSSVFSPANYSNVVLSASTVTGENFGASLGYTVSGSVTYSGTQTGGGQIYLNLVNNNCGGSGGEGTSITTPGSFIINGVPPGSYTLQSWMDPFTLNEGVANVVDPTGSAAVSVPSANASGISVTLNDPTLSAPTETPKLKAIEPTDSGVAITFGGGSVSNGNGVEVFTSYLIEASDNDPSFASPITATYKGIGANANIWIMNNGTAGLTGGTFSDTQQYYFRVMGLSAAGNSGWVYWGGPGVTCALSTCAVTVTVGGQPSGPWSPVTLTVVIPSTITPTGPLYMGLFDEANNVAYATYTANPTNDPAGNSLTVDVPNGSNYFAFGILDQNKDGLIDVGDVSNTNSNGGPMVSVSGATSVPSFTLPSANSTALVQTQFNQDLFWNGTSSQTNTSYNLNFQVREGNKLPVSVQLKSASNPNVITPVDVSNYCQGCGNVQFLLSTAIGSTAPAVNDSYSFLVNYSDLSSETVVAKVTGVLGTSALATNLEPEQTDSTSTTPTFTWTYPASPSSYVYQFYVCCGGSGNIWQIPGNNSNSNGFTNTQIPAPVSLVWGTDPTNGSNVPNATLNSTGTTYNWSIQSQDSNGNSAQNTVWYEPLP
jgi:hypothetical protein